MERDRLQRRLRHVETLAQRGATEGERAAARRAAWRLRVRLREVPVPAGRVLRVVSNEPDPIEVGRDDLSLPGRDELRGVLHAWRFGDIDDAEVGAWAHTYVDGLLLPDLPPEDPDSIAVELLLQLSTLPGGPVGLDRVDQLLEFLSHTP